MTPDEAQRIANIVALQAEMDDSEWLAARFAAEFPDHDWAAMVSASRVWGDSEWAQTKRAEMATRIRQAIAELTAPDDGAPDKIERPGWAASSWPRSHIEE